MTSRAKIINVYSRLLILLLILLMVLSAHSQTSIFAMEYYIDTDPGIGAGVDIPISSGVNQDIDIAIDMSGLTVGFHELVVRARYSDGTWGLQESKVFYVSASTVASATDVTALEYYFDTDPGYGNGEAIAISPSNSIDTDALISTSSLSSGFHSLYVRARDSDGLWGIMKSRVFYVDDIDRDLNTSISSVEYFINTDPGFGSGTQYVISPSQASIDEDITVSTSTLPDGDYTIGVRVQDTGGSFSVTETASFVICSGADVDFSASSACEGSSTEFTDLSANILEGDIYSWDFDGDGIEDSNVAGDVSYTYPSSGTFTASLTINQNGCVLSKSLEVSVAETPEANAGEDQTISMDNTTLAATPVNTGETGEWSLIEGTASITDAGDPTTTVTGISGSQVQLRWTVTAVGTTCEDSDDVIINVEDALSNETDILTFSLSELSNPATIDNANHTVTAEVVYGTDITSLEPAISVSVGASINPTGVQDFTNPVIYTVVAEDGITTQNWTVTIEDALNNQTDIQNFTLAEQVSEAEINVTEGTVSIEVELGTDLTSLEPTITLSEGASVSPSGTQNFTNPVIYTVLAEDGITERNWTAIILERPLGLIQNSGIQVYPNPSSSVVFIDGVEGDYVISLSDLSGKILEVKENTSELSLINLEPGTYLLNITVNGDSPKSVRIIKGN